MPRILSPAERIARVDRVEAPSVETVNLQVRTGMSVPFAPHMVDKDGAADAPSVEPVNLQVRTGMSVPFASYMTGRPAEKVPGAAKPAVDKKVGK